MNKQEKKERQAKAESDYKNFTKDIQSLTPNEDPKRIQEVITEHLSKSNDLYPLIRKKLTGSSADAKHMRLLLQLCTDTAKRINTQSNPFNLKELISKLKKEHKNNLNNFIYDRTTQFICTAPTFEFFYGAIRREALEIKQRKKRIKIQADEARAISATEKNIAVDCEQDSTPKEVELICERIKRLSNSRNNRRVPFLSAIVDPCSFTQTVENIFHTSFLVKEGKIGVKKDTNNKPVIEYESNPDSSQEREKPKKQSILSFSMADFNRWKRQMESV